MLRYYLFFCMCLAVGCGDAGSVLAGGSGGGGTGGGGTGGDPLLRMEVEDFSGFTSFRYTTQDFGFCNPSEYVASAEITRRADGELAFSYTALLLGDSALDDCVGIYGPPDCLVEESAGPRVLSADEWSRVHAIFAEVLFTGRDTNCPAECDPCINSAFEWDEMRHVDDFCSCPSFAISYGSIAAITSLLELLRLGG